ncbi:MAG: ABC transporter permease [Hyphomicrobiaceae bacterium]
MADRSRTPALEIRALNVYYGASHALQGVDLSLKAGVLSVVGRNGMGKTTLCKAIMGLVPVASGSINFAGQSLTGLAPADIAQLGIGYVPQGRRLWPSLTVDEHLRLMDGRRKGAWTIDRIYTTFPRLAERKSNGGGQLSGGEQQMLAISRALLANPRLLVMDEPTEGLAPVIVAQLEEMLQQLGEDGDMDVLVIEQNIGVACAVADNVAIMVNGRINRISAARDLAGDRELQQRLLGVGRHGHEDIAPVATTEPAAPSGSASAATAPFKIYNSNPVLPTRWSQPIPVQRLEQLARVVTTRPVAGAMSSVEIRPLAAAGRPVVLVAGTLDTKGDELRYMRDLIQSAGLPVRMVDLSTTGRHSGAEISANQVAAFHPRGAAGVFTGDRGQSVAGMTEAFRRWILRQSGIAGVLSAGGSGGTAMVAPAMRALPVGIPKLIVSTVASGEVKKYVGPSDIMLMPSVADVQGLNAITEEVLANAAQAMIGMVAARQSAKPRTVTKPAIGLTMFGVTTPCVQQVTKQLTATHDCLVFHATGVGGQAMEALVDGGKIVGVLDISTTEVCDLLMGGVFPATEDRFGAIIRTRIPYIGSVGALDMVNFGAPDSVPPRYAGRQLYRHNPQITLMRTTPEECTRMGRWIGERLNRMEGQVRFFLPEGGVSALDAPGKPFHDLTARAALFAALVETVRQTASRQLIQVPHHINAPEFAAVLIAAFRDLHGDGRARARVGMKR